MKSILTLVVMASLLFASCGMGDKQVEGNGNIRTDQRTVSSFSKVTVHGDIFVFISQEAQKPVQIETDENLLAYIDIVQEGDELTIKPKDDFKVDPSDDIKVYLSSPELESIDVSGASKVTGQTKVESRNELRLHISGAGSINMQVDVPEITAKLSGSSKLNLKGETKRFKLGVSGDSEVRCYDLLSENTTVNISGSGKAEVHASVKLDAEVSGSANITFRGNPKSVQQETSGSGSIRPAN